MSRAVMQQALEALEKGLYGQTSFEMDAAKIALRKELAKPELMRMPKLGDRVVFIEGGIEGTVRFISFLGGPYIKFDDGTDGQWSLYEFGEMFYYQEKE